MDFYNKISEVLKSIGMKNSVVEPCVFYTSKVKLTLYVDDGLLFGMKKDIDEILLQLQKEFTLTINRVPKVSLGITINAINKGEIKLSLCDYLSKIQTENNITPNYRNYTPLPENYDINNPSELHNKDEITHYQKIIGILNYATSTVRIDIAYATSLLARKSPSPTQYNLKTAKRVLNYLVASKELGITYKQNNTLDIEIVNSFYIKERKPHIIDLPNDNEIKVITDASWADQKDRSSLFGFITVLNSNIISWKSKNISNITLSTCESEIEGTKNALFIRNFLKELRFFLSPIKVVNDNMAALSVADHYCNRSKHIEIKWFFTRELVERKEIELFYIQTNQNISDPLTKNLNKVC